MPTYVIQLPFPVSANRLWRKAKGTIHLSIEYQEWIKQADALYLTQVRKLQPGMLGVFSYRMTFDAARRGRFDGDNLTKCVLDWLQRVKVVRNDRACEGGSWAWGLASSGCEVSVSGEIAE